MIDKQAARPEVNYAQSDPRMTREQNTELMARQIRAQSEFDRQTLIEFHERFAGKLVALSNDLKGCGIDVGSLPEEIQHIDPPEVNWGVINGILNNLGGFAEKLPDNDADLSCKP